MNLVNTTTMPTEPIRTMLKVAASEVRMDLHREGREPHLVIVTRGATPCYVGRRVTYGMAWTMATINLWGGGPMAHVVDCDGITKLMPPSPGVTIIGGPSLGLPEQWVGEFWGTMLHEFLHHVRNRTWLDENPQAKTIPNSRSARRREEREIAEQVLDIRRHGFPDVLQAEISKLILWRMKDCRRADKQHSSRLRGRIERYRRSEFERLGLMPKGESDGTQTGLAHPAQESA